MWDGGTGGARFCPACGHAHASRGDERRIATVLFADIVGYTALAETADPEQVKELVDRCFERLGADVTAFGGKVDKIVGDALVALFGAPVAHEDDAERAVRAALRMQASMAEHAAAEGVDLRVRIGVNTGEVVVGSLRAGGEYTAMGDVVNTAQRLQTLAEPGAVVVGSATRAATGDAIAYRELGPVEVKGRDEPVTAFEALEPLLPPGYRPRRTGGPLVGREHELRLLEEAVAVAVRRRRAQLVVLIGEAGQGKSRLAAELACRAGVSHEARVLEGRCVPYGEANPFWPIAEALRHACRIRGQAHPAEAAAAARVAAAEVLEVAEDDPEAQRLADGLLHLMGYDVDRRTVDPQRSRDEARWAAVRYLEASARRAPLALVLSDLHWAEPPVLELIEVVLDRLGRCPFVLLATTRTALADQLPNGVGRHNALVLNVDPLDLDAATELLDALAGRPLEPRLRAELLDRAGGNPLFLEELVALMCEAGTTPAGADVGGAGGAATARLGTSSLDGLPDTLRGLVSARIDALGEAERLVLEDAAVWGHAGKVAVLAEMGVTHPGLRLAEALDGLVDRDVLVLDGDRWAFRSELVREVAYGMLTKSDRARRHAGIAWYLDRGQPTPAEATDRTVDVVAHHYVAAASLVAEVGVVPGLPHRLADRAVAWLEEAAVRAERSMQHQLVRQLCSQALDLPVDAAGAPADVAARRARLLLHRARAHASSRHLDAARADVREAEALAVVTDDDVLAAEVLATRGDVEQKAGAFAASETTLLAAIDAFRAAGDDHGAADSLRMLGLTRIFSGDDQGAEEAITASLDIYRALDDRRGVAWALQHLAWISFVATRPEEAEARLNESAATFAALGDEGGLVWTDGLLAFVRYQRGDLAGAGELGARIEREARARGDRWGQGMMQALQAGVELWSGRAGAAVRDATEARATFRELGDVFGEVQASVGLGRALVIVGEVEAGLEVLEGTVASVDGSPDRAVVRTMAANGLAAALVQVGEPERAASVLGQAGASTASRPAVGDVERAVADALVLVQQGEADAALGLLDALLSPDEVEGDARRSPYVASVLALAAATAGRPPAEVERHARDLVLDGAGSYLDRFVAALAVALTRCAGGGADELAGLDALVGVLEDLDDQVAPAVLAVARAGARERLGLPGASELAAEADSAWAELGVDGHGWRLAIAQALAGGRRAVTSGS